MIALLIIIYISFISLGLPDSILGSAWPVMRTDLSASFAVAGYNSMIVQAGTIISSLFSNRLINRYGTGNVTVVSVAATAIALFGYSIAPNVWFLFVCAIPMGLGAGSIDAALNNFVANHFDSKHMSWLHCFWGVGATIGPAIISSALLTRGSWRAGYVTIAIIQSSLFAVLLVTLPLWTKYAKKSAALSDAQTKIISNRNALKIPYVKLALVSFVFFCATEATTGLWTSSYLVMNKGVSAALAARTVSCFYGAIAFGRLISGFASIKLKSHILIRTGQLICVAGAVLLMLPLPVLFSVIGIILIGLGTAPIFPSMLHETPNRFGATASQAVMGLQMAFAYIGSTCFPPLFGSIATVTSVSYLPLFLLICIVVMLVSSELFQQKSNQLQHQ